MVITRKLTGTGTQNSEFLTKEAFVKAHENDEKGKITNIVINDSYQTVPNAVTKRVDVNYVLESGEVGYTSVTVTNTKSICFSLISMT